MERGDTLARLIADLAAHGEKTAILAMAADGPRRWSYAELAAAAGAIAGGLAARGAVPGEPVAILAPNCAEWVVARLGLIAAGAPAVPLDDLVANAELARIIADSGARRIFTTWPYAERLAALGLADDLHIHRLDDDPAGPGEHWRHLVADGPRTQPGAGPEDMASLFYTSGTTGLPKGVPLSHRNIVTNLVELRAQGFIDAGDRVMLPLPLHHAYPFIIGMLWPLSTGATIVLPAGLTGPEIAAALRDGRATAMVGVPRLYDGLIAGIRARVAGRGALARALFETMLALSTAVRRRLGLRLGRRLFAALHHQLAPDLRLLGCGGARLEPATEWALEALGWQVATGYGLVETTSIATFNPRGRSRVGSAGCPVRGVELRIDDPDREGRGEILIRGPTVFTGYRNDPEADAAAFAVDGWFRTGDLGHRDADGYLFITGRAKELIVMPGGKNVTPELVEAHYAQSPFIAEMAVLEAGGALVGLVVPDLDALRGAPSSRLGEVIRVSLAELSPGLPSFQRISGYAVTREALPRTRLGKYRRFALPDIYHRARSSTPDATPAAMSAADEALVAAPRAGPLWAFMRAHYPDRQLSLDTAPQLDLGIDSLAWIDLSVEIEAALGLRIDEDAIARIVTLRDLLEAAEAVSGRAPAGPTRLDAAERRWIEPRGPGHLAFARVLHIADRLLMRLYFSLQVVGAGNLPRSGPVAIVANHISDLDPLVVYAALPWPRLANIHWGGEASRLFSSRPRRAIARATNIFPVDDRAPATSLAYARAVLDRGDSLIWFPESWRSPDGRLQPFLPGIGVLLGEFRGAIVPAVIEGTFEAMPRGSRLPRPVRARVTFGAPTTVEVARSRGTGETDAARIAAGLHGVVSDLASSAPRRDG